MTPVLFLSVPAALIGGLAAWWVARAYGRAGGKPGPALIGVGIGLVAAAGLYLAIGRPALPDEPFRPRLAALLGKNPDEMTPNELLTVLDARAKMNSADPAPLIFSGEILTELGRPDLAISQYDEALARNANSAPALIGLGRAQVAMEQGKITAEALKSFSRAREAAPEDPIPWLYQALAASQDGQYADAAVLWPEVLKRLPSDDPRRRMAKQMIAEARAKTAQRR
jgi:cytochrome c-type biogenesis protein CcmH/NrfG